MIADRRPLGRIMFDAMVTTGEVLGTAAFLAIAVVAVVTAQVAVILRSIV